MESRLGFWPKEDYEVIRRNEIDVDLDTILD